MIQRGTTMKRILSAFILAGLLLTVGCSTNKNREVHKQVRDLAKTGQIDDALKIVKSKNFYPSQDDKLVKLLEEGSLHYLKKNYYQALQIFDQAQELSDLLFTQSIKGKVASVVINDNMDKYYGEKYERSLIRFYQALSNYMLYQIGKYEAHSVLEEIDGKMVKKDFPERALEINEKRTHLAAARANILNWDSLLENYRSLSGGKPTYKDDLVAKIFGAFIHEQMGSRSDLQIAVKLYQAAQDILFKNYGFYETFNNKSSHFKKDFNKFAQMGMDKVKQEYFEETQNYKLLQNFLDERIKKLTSGKKDNVFLFMQGGFIAEKVANKIEFPIPATSMAAAGVAGFASRLLGDSSGSGPLKIAFELPEIKKSKKRLHYKLIVTDSHDKIVAQRPLSVIGPFSDIAYETMNEKQTATYTKIGLRLVSKHVAAILAAYEINKKAGYLAASLAYAASNKGIEASEQVDLRFWSLLPNHITISSLSLPPGRYKLKVEYQDEKNPQFQGLVDWNQELEVSKSGTSMVDLRIYY